MAIIRYAKNKRSTLNTYAIKIVEKSKLLTDNVDIFLYHNEYKIQKDLSHNFIVKNSSSYVAKTKKSLSRQ